MKSIFIIILTFIFFPAAIFSQQVLSININGGINPASAEYIHQAIEKAVSENKECLLIHLNTPGGLLSSTREIVHDMLESKVPVIVYISPSGAHAGSAGVFITYAANIAVMAPGTNFGAAHPVSLSGGTDSIMNTKSTNDAVAFIKTIAQKRNRNADWGEQAVRYSYSITEDQALEINAIDLIAANDHELLQKIDGKKVEINGDSTILQTKNATVENYEMGFFQKILDWISDPNIAYMLMMLGFYGILFELFNPGLIFPGVAGVIFLVFAFYAMSSMPVNYAGLSLIIFGIVLFLLEIKITSHGILTIGGIISILLGSLFLFRTTPVENFVSISRGIIIGCTAVTALFFLFITGVGLKAQRLKPATGLHTLIGKTAEAATMINPQGSVNIFGEIWNAESLSGKINPGEKIIIKKIKGFTLYVEALPEPGIDS